MNVPFFSSVREYHDYKNDFDNAISAVLEKGDFILGNAVKELEDSVSKYASANYGIGCANGSDALVLASNACGFTEGTEVITPVFTFFASASCIARNGAKPVFCDVDEDTFCMDMNDASKRITKNTKGLIPVHLFSQTTDMNKCLELARDNNLRIVEDAAEAFGMKTLINGEYKTAGSIGDAGVYSFFPTKTLGGYGDGGMVITSDEEIANKSKYLRVHGATKKYHHEYVGYNSRLDTIQAAILNVKMKHIDLSIQKREEHATQYFELLKDIPEVSLPVIKDGNKPVYYVFQTKVQKRDELANFLKDNGVGTCVYYPVPLHMQKCFEYLGYKKGDFPIAEKLCEQALALPMYPEITEDEISYTCEMIKKFYK